ncbi:MAG TPA: hypothetical protein VHA52_01625, partial [Candidatus Babeliaceae bacterium]|nr:hypothetical protein [Candidatus Babeliaceae bacterium]
MSKLWTIIIVGATGDLSKRKLLPALYALLKRQSIDFRVVAIAREVKTVAEIVDQARSFIVDYDSVIFNELVSRTTYCSVDVTVAQDFKKLALV